MPTGIALALPEGYVALVHPRSGLAARHGLSIVNTPGTVDAGYRGEIKVLLVNLDPREPVELRRGDRIAQLVVQRVRAGAVFTEVDALPGVGRAAPGDTVQPEARPRSASRRPPTARDRRRRRTDVPPQGPSSEPDEAVERRGARPAARTRPSGPWDVRGPRRRRASTGSTSARCCVPPREGAELQLQVDESSGEVQSVMLAGEDGRPRAAGLRGAAQRRPLGRGAAARSPRDIAQHGGTATERRGPLGHRAGLPDAGGAARRHPGDAAVPDHRHQRPPLAAARDVPRASRRSSPTAPRTGRTPCAVVVVHRGTHAMPVGDALPLTLPDDAQRLELTGPRIRRFAD